VLELWEESKETYCLSKLTSTGETLKMLKTTK